MNSALRTFILLIPAVLMLACTSDDDTDDIPSTLIANWHADGDTVDSAGSHNGTLSNGADYTQGRSGQAFSFDGIDDRVNITDASALDLTNGFTIHAWINPSALPAQAFDSAAILAKFNSTGTSPVYGLFIRGSGQLLVQIFTTDVGVFGTSSTTVVPIDTWTHVAGTYDGQTLRMYVNGVQDPSTLDVSGDRTLENSSEPVVLGYSDGNWDIGFEGAIDEIELHDEALSSADIEAAAQ